MTDPRITSVKDLIELCPDFPKPGITFQNLFPVLRNPSVFKGLIDVLVEDIKSKYPAVEVIVGLDSRGFLFGPMIAQELNVAFVPVRKKGKLPGETLCVEYTLEYGKDACEIQKNSIQPGQKVVIVDDLLQQEGGGRPNMFLEKLFQTRTGIRILPLIFRIIVDIESKVSKTVLLSKQTDMKEHYIIGFRICVDKHKGKLADVAPWHLAGQERLSWVHGARQIVAV